MRVVIIEDERVIAEDLKQAILQADDSIAISAIVKSVGEGVEWFNTNPHPDLIFSDIQLGDGLSFEILKELQVPVIFCTAFDEYALNAFKVNGIDYLLKPFTRASVRAALLKFKNLTQAGQDNVAQQYESIKQLFSDAKKTKASSLLIHFKDTIYPVKIDDVALFRLEHEMVYLQTFDDKTHYPGKSLEELENLVGDDFFRVNRQYLVNRKAVTNATSLFSRKLSLNLNVPVKEGITISREKAVLFLRWLSGE